MVTLKCQDQFLVPVCHWCIATILTNFYLLLLLFFGGGGGMTVRRGFICRAIKWNKNNKCITILTITLLILKSLMDVDIRFMCSISFFFFGNKLCGSLKPLLHIGGSWRFGILPCTAEERVNTVFNPQSSITHPQCSVRAAGNRQKN